MRCVFDCSLAANAIVGRRPSCSNMEVVVEWVRVKQSRAGYRVSANFQNRVGPGISAKIKIVRLFVILWLASRGGTGL